MALLIDWIWARERAREDPRFLTHSTVQQVSERRGAGLREKTGSVWDMLSGCRVTCTRCPVAQERRLARREKFRCHKFHLEA